jgi:hypothetical protein
MYTPIPSIARQARILLVALLSYAAVSPAQVAPSPPTNVVVDGWSFTFADKFDYDVGRSGGAQSLFTSRGWNYVKAQNFTNSGHGYVYTRWDPTMNSRVLVLEAVPSTAPPVTGFVNQTDFYLQYGSENSSLSTIPADAWIQFWTYATPESRFAMQDKVLYPTRSTYPSSDLGWQLLWGSNGYERGIMDAPAGARFIGVFSNHADYRVDFDPGMDPAMNHKLFQNANRRALLPGIWYQVRLHLDTSGRYVNPTNGQPSGRYEAWIRARGETAWLKVADYRPGITGGPNGLYWPLTSSQQAGHRMLRMPTTVNRYDNTILIEDFVISEDEPADVLP